MVVAVLVAVGLRFLFVADPHRAWPCGPWSTTPTCSSSTRGRPERLAMASWALGAFLAVLAGVLITPIQGSTMSADRADAARHRRLRGRDVRAAAQRAADVRRRPRARPRRQLRDRLLPRRRVDLGRQLPGVAADDRPVRRAAVPAAGPAAGRHRAAHPRALPHARACATRVIGAVALVVGMFLRARPAGADVDQHPRLRHDGLGHRPVARAAHRLRRRDQPGRAVVRGHRGDRRPPLRGRRQRAGRPLDAARLRAGGRRVRAGRRARGAAVAAPARPVPGAVDDGVRRVRRRTCSCARSSTGSCR